MQILDSQVHVWVTPRSEYPPLWAHRRIPQFTYNDLLKEMRDAGVDRAILAPTGASGGPAHALEAVAAHPNKFASLVVMPFDRRGSPDPLSGMRPRDGFIGVRAAVGTPTNMAKLQAGDLDDILAAAEEEDIPLASVVIASHHEEISRLAKKFPRLRIMISHLGSRSDTGARDSEAFAHLPTLLELARYSHVAVAASGVAGYVTESYPYPGLDNILRQTFNAFGADRFFWGSDLTRLSDPYLKCVTHFTEKLPWLKGHALEQVMGGGLQAWLKWPAWS